MVVLHMNNHCFFQMTVREALNSALDEEMSADPKVFLMGEEVTLGKSFFELFNFSYSLYSSELHNAYLPSFQVGEYQGAYKV